MSLVTVSLKVIEDTLFVESITIDNKYVSKKERKRYINGFGLETIHHLFRKPYAVVCFTRTSDGNFTFHFMLEISQVKGRYQFQKKHLFMY